MKTKQSGYDECVGFTRFVMKIMGIWPGVEFSPKWYAQYIFLIPLFFLTFFILIPQTRMLLYVTDDLNYIIEILTTADVITVVACLKLVGVWYNKRGAYIHSSNITLTQIYYNLCLRCAMFVFFKYKFQICSMKYFDIPKFYVFKILGTC